MLNLQDEAHVMSSCEMTESIREKYGITSLKDWLHLELRSCGNAAKDIIKTFALSRNKYK